MTEKNYNNFNSDNKTIGIFVDFVNHKILLSNLEAKEIRNGSAMANSLNDFFAEVGSNIAME